MPFLVSKSSCNAVRKPPPLKLSHALGWEFLMPFIMLNFCFLNLLVSFNDPLPAMEQEKEGVKMYMSERERDRARDCTCSALSVVSVS